MKLILIRGIPGSGKSTYAKTLSGFIASSEHFEADMFWMLKDGSYAFDMKKIAYAHKWCLAKVIEALQREWISCVIVSNTFTTTKEMQPYIDLAKDYNVPVSIVEMKTQYQNIHNVPEDVLIKMKNRWEEIPDYWNVTKEVIQ